MPDPSGGCYFSLREGLSAFRKNHMLYVQGRRSGVVPLWQSGGDAMDDVLAHGKTELILRQLKERIDSFESKSIWYRRTYFITSIGLLLISAAVTVIAGWKPPSADTTNIVLVLSTLLTVLSGYGLFYSPKNSWLIFASSTNRLRALRGKIEFMRADQISSQDEDKLARESFAEFQTILDETNKAWLDLRTGAAPSTVTSRVPAAAHTSSGLST